MSKLALFKKRVLTDSLTYFVRLARMHVEPVAAATMDDSNATIPDRDSDTDSSAVAVGNATLASSTAVSENGQASDLQPLPLELVNVTVSPAPVPFCPAQAQLAILLCDFFKLESHT